MDHTSLLSEQSADVGAAQPPCSVAPPSVDTPLNTWWRIADVVVFGLWLALVGVILQHHEPWADEAQSWLLARDLDFKTLWFHELRYNGTPGLWHTILWIAQHWFHAPYSAMGVIGMCCAAAGVSFILWKAPFPRPLRYLLVFSYFLVYQYAVIARSYNLFPLLLFAAAYFYRDRTRPVRMTVVLILLANVSTHGTLLAAALGFFYLIEAFKERSALTQSVRRRYPFCVAAMALTLIFVFLVVRSVPDVAVVLNHRDYTSAWKELKNTVAYSFFDVFALSAIFLVLASAWCYERRRLLSFILPVSLVLSFLVAVYVRAHHHGIVFLAAIAGLWIAWPTKDEKQQFSPFERLSAYAMTGLLVCLFSLNIWDAVVAMHNDYLYPYCGSADAAAYLKRVGADHATIFGYTYGVAALQAYFDNNILLNIPTTYYHEGRPVYGEAMDLRQLQSAAPEYVIIFSHDPKTDFNVVEEPLTNMGYRLVHFSDARLYYKRLALYPMSFLIFEHIEPGATQAPAQLDPGR